jgi:hypothetical protein
MIAEPGIAQVLRLRQGPQARKACYTDIGKQFPQA